MPQEELARAPQSKRVSQCDNCADMERLVALVKEKMAIIPTSRHVQLLTLAPESWSIEKTVTEFNTTEYKVKESRKLKKEKGILPEPKAKAGKTLSKEVEKKVKEFYENDEYSRLLPGAKDYKSVKGPDGKRERLTKRLLLMNLNELHENYKKLNPGDKIGLSKFCSLRPKHCITVGCRGTHSVCVCSIHQNVKLMVGALPTESTITYHELMEKLV